MINNMDFIKTFFLYKSIKISKKFCKEISILNIVSETPSENEKFQFRGTGCRLTEFKPMELLFINGKVAKEHHI